jgi:hypothetical protein
LILFLDLAPNWSDILEKDGDDWMMPIVVRGDGARISRKKNQTFLAVSPLKDHPKLDGLLAVQPILIMEGGESYDALAECLKECNIELGRLKNTGFLYKGRNVKSMFQIAKSNT